MPPSRMAPEGKVTPDWREQGVWISRAWQEFGPAAFVERATQAADQFAKLRDGETPEMFLRSAGLLFAHWRKALSRLHGEAHEAFVAYCANRDAAQCCVLIGLRDGGLIGIGNRRGSAHDEWIPTLHWDDYSLSLDPEHRDVVRGDEGVVWHRARVVEAKQWFEGPAVIPEPSALTGRTVRPSSVKFEEWFETFDKKSPPTMREADSWALEKKYNRDCCRQLLREKTKPKHGRRAKHQ